MPADFGYKALRLLTDPLRHFLRFRIGNDLKLAPISDDNASAIWSERASSRSTSDPPPVEIALSIASRCPLTSATKRRACSLIRSATSCVFASEAVSKSLDLGRQRLGNMVRARLKPLDKRPAFHRNGAFDGFEMRPDLFRKTPRLLADPFRDNIGLQVDPLVQIAAMQRNRVLDRCRVERQLPW